MEALQRDEPGKRTSYFKAQSGVERYTLIAPQAAAGSRHVCDAPLCGSMSKHFTCPLVACGLRAHFTFLPCKAKTFHFCAADIHSLAAHYICAKISRPEPPNIFVAFHSCLAAQDIKGRFRHAARIYSAAEDLRFFCIITTKTATAAAISTTPPVTPMAMAASGVMNGSVNCVTVPHMFSGRSGRE